MSHHLYFSHRVRRFNLALLALVLSAGSTLAFAHEKEEALREADAQFIKNAGQGNTAEVTLGQMAINKTQSSAVKKFGAEIVQDHSKANEKLLKIAHEYAVSVPTDLTPEQQRLKESLAPLNGPEFDKKYMSAMVADHRKDIDEFEKTAAQAHDREVKRFAKQALPTLKKHLRMAETIVKDQNH